MKKFFIFVIIVLIILAMYFLLFREKEEFDVNDVLIDREEIIN